MSTAHIYFWARLSRVKYTALVLIKQNFYWYTLHRAQLFPQKFRISSTLVTTITLDFFSKAP